MLPPSLPTHSFVPRAFSGSDPSGYDFMLCQVQLRLSAQMQTRSAPALARLVQGLSDLFPAHVSCACVWLLSQGFSRLQGTTWHSQKPGRVYGSWSHLCPTEELHPAGKSFHWALTLLPLRKSSGSSNHLPLLIVNLTTHRVFTVLCSLLVLVPPYSCTLKSHFQIRHTC